MTLGLRRKQPIAQRVEIKQSEIRAQTKVVYHTKGKELAAIPPLHDDVRAQTKLLF